MKNFTLFFALLFLPLRLLATDCIPDCECETDWTLEVRGAYYQPYSRSFKHVYTDHFIDYQVEAAKRIYDFVEIWAGVNWTSKHGHTRRSYGAYDYSFRDRTKIFILPISLGLKLIYPILPYVDIYTAVGVSYSFLRIKNFCKENYSHWGAHHSPFKKVIYKNNVGAVFKVGIQYAMSYSTFLDLFADYYLQNFRFSRHEDKTNRYIFRHNLECSGFKFGLGFGVYF